MENTLVKAPICRHCGESLNDWHGNVMVDYNSMINNSIVERIEIWCKDCTKKMGSYGRREYHSIWELYRIQQDFFRLLECKVTNKDGISFNNHAIEQLIDLGRMVYGVSVPNRNEK